MIKKIVERIKGKTKIKKPSSETRENLIKLANNENKWIDLRQRYSSQYVIEYIEKSCKENYFVEAYCIAQQYIILSIERLFPGLKRYLKGHRISDFSLIAFLNGIKVLNSKLFSKWEKLITERNKMAHDLIDNPEKLSSLSKEKKEKMIKFLIECIENADDFFIDTFKDFIKKEQIIFKPEKQHAIHLVDIAIKRIRRSGTKWSIYSKEKNRELVKKELKSMKVWELIVKQE